MNTLLHIAMLTPFIAPAVLIVIFMVAYLIFSDDKGEALDDLAMYDE
jgi:hypothetical protein